MRRLSSGFSPLERRVKASDYLTVTMQLERRRRTRRHIAGSSAFTEPPESRKRTNPRVLRWPVHEGGRRNATSVTSVGFGSSCSPLIEERNPDGSQRACFNRRVEIVPRACAAT